MGTLERLGFARKRCEMPFRKRAPRCFARLPPPERRFRAAVGLFLGQITTDRSVMML